MSEQNGADGARSFEIKVGLAEMMKNGVIMDVTVPEQAKIAEDAGACAVMAPFFTTHEMHCVRWAEEISEWLPAAAANGVDAFTFARFGPIDPDRVNAAGVDVTEGQHQTVSGLYLSRFRIQDAQPRAEP